MQFSSKCTSGLPVACSSVQQQLLLPAHSTQQLGTMASGSFRPVIFVYFKTSHLLLRIYPHMQVWRSGIVRQQLL